MKHTPGPWIFREMPYPEENDKHWIDNKNGKPLAEVRDYGIEGIANAQLIAVAPDLLKALKNIVNWHREKDSGEGELYGRDYITTAISAIRKAEGGGVKCQQHIISHKPNLIMN